MGSSELRRHTCKDILPEQIRANKMTYWPIKDLANQHSSLMTNVDCFYKYL